MELKLMSQEGMIIFTFRKRRYHNRRIQRDVIKSRKPLIGDSMGHTPPYTHRHSGKRRTDSADPTCIVCFWSPAIIHSAAPVIFCFQLIWSTYQRNLSKRKRRRKKMRWWMGMKIWTPTIGWWSTKSEVKRVEVPVLWGLHFAAAWTVPLHLGQSLMKWTMTWSSKWFLRHRQRKARRWPCMQTRWRVNWKA